MYKILAYWITDLENEKIKIQKKDNDIEQYKDPFIMPIIKEI